MALRAMKSLPGRGEPGTIVIITDQPVVRSRGNAAILEG